jgi:N6-adenosine-specific RNA methylase IME4
MEKFKVIVADPPWSFNDKLTMNSVKRGAESNYRTMTLEDIVTLPVISWAQEDAILALWIPSALIYDGLRVMQSWGFEMKQIYTWVKTCKNPDIYNQGLAFGMGHHFRGCTEHALIGTRGKIKPLSRSQRNCDLDQALRHSKKPESLQDKLEKMYNGPYLELFARRDRPNWTCIGNECPSTMGLDIRDWNPQFE